jgi:hypothetical protein
MSERLAMTDTTLLLGMIAIMLAGGVVLVNILREVLPKQIVQSAKLEEMENRIYVLHAEVHDRQERLAGLRAASNRQSSEKTRFESEIRKMDRAVMELANQPPLFIHELGDPQHGATKFIIDLRYQSPSRRNANGTSERSILNPIWRKPNVAEVWARTQEEARQLVDVAYPTKLGFVKSFAAPKASATDRLVEQVQKSALSKAGAA